MNPLVHNTFKKTSSMPTNSASVELALCIELLLCRHQTDNSNSKRHCSSGMTIEILLYRVCCIYIPCYGLRAIVSTHRSNKTLSCLLQEAKPFSWLVSATTQSPLLDSAVRVAKKAAAPDSMSCLPCLHRKLTIHDKCMKYLSPLVVVKLPWWRINCE